TGSPFRAPGGGDRRTRLLGCLPGRFPVLLCDHAFVSADVADEHQAVAGLRGDDHGLFLAVADVAQLHLRFLVVLRDRRTRPLDACLGRGGGDRGAVDGDQAVAALQAGLVSGATGRDGNDAHARRLVGGEYHANHRLAQQRLRSMLRREFGVGPGGLVEFPACLVEGLLLGGGRCGRRPLLCRHGQRHRHCDRQGQCGEGGGYGFHGSFLGWSQSTLTSIASLRPCDASSRWVLSKPAAWRSASTRACHSGSRSASVRSARASPVSMAATRASSSEDSIAAPALATRSSRATDSSASSRADSAYRSWSLVVPGAGAADAAMPSFAASAAPTGVLPGSSTRPHGATSMATSAAAAATPILAGARLGAAMIGANRVL